MAPSLVICPPGQGYKLYSGGVIVLSAVDWLGSARGTLTTVSDARSCCGSVVQDTQRVTDSIRDYHNNTSDAAFQNADDTLVVDLSLLPVEIGRRYIMLTSILIEGDWDPTDTDSTWDASQTRHRHACSFDWYGDSTFASDANTSHINFMTRGWNQYRISGWGSDWAINTVAGTEVLHFRAFSKDGSTITWNIDQIYLIPSKFDSAYEQNRIPGEWGADSAVYGLDPGGGWVDGADGGDANGKFTFMPVMFDPPTGGSISGGGDGGGDYQQDDSEYFVRIVPDDFFELRDSTLPLPNQEPPSSVCYGVHGAYYVPTQQWVNDDFDRSVGDGDFSVADNHFAASPQLGIGPQGFGWGGAGATGPSGGGADSANWGAAMWVEGGEACFEIHSSTLIMDDALSLRAWLMPNSSNPSGASCVVTDEEGFKLYGECRFDEIQSPFNDATGDGYSYAYFGTRWDLSDFNGYYIRVDFIDKTWVLVHAQTGEASPLVGPVDISAWLDFGVQFAMKIELRRFNLKAKLWEISGGEPGTWDYDDFRPLNRSPTGTKTYPYGTPNDLRYSATRSNDRQVPMIGHRDAMTNGVLRVCFDNITMDYDVGGDAGSTWFLMEHLEGNEVGRIEIVPGAQHLVFWGKRDWTTYDAGFPAGHRSLIEFSSKNWNEAGSADLQRADTVFWWLRRGLGGIVSMNWRSGERQHQGGRVLVGR